MRDLETNVLIDKMKDNYTESLINLSQKTKNYLEKTVEKK